MGRGKGKKGSKTRRLRRRKHQPGAVKDTKMINQMIYTPSGVVGKSQLTIKRLGRQMIPEGFPASHVKGSSFAIVNNIVAEFQICKFTRDDMMHFRAHVPVLFLNIWCGESHSLFQLFQVFLQFKFPEIVDEERYFSGEPLDGKLMFEVVIDDTRRMIDAGIDTFSDPKQLAQQIIQFMRSDAMVAYVVKMAEQEKAKREEERYESYKNMIAYNKPSVTFTSDGKMVKNFDSGLQLSDPDFTESEDDLEDKTMPVPADEQTVQADK